LIVVNKKYFYLRNYENIRKTNWEKKPYFFFEEKKKPHLKPPYNINIKWKHKGEKTKITIMKKFQIKTQKLINIHI
jgi:ribonuclease BN (tRNA processing enzyme)